MKEKIDKMIKMVGKFRVIWNEAKKVADGSVMKTLGLVLKEQILCRAGYSRYDFFQCELYRLGMMGRREFLNVRRAKRVRDICNQPDECVKFRDKSIFNKEFAEYIHRDWLDLRVDGLESFQKFVAKHSTFMVKPQFLEGGRGIQKIEITAESNLKAIYEKLKKEGALLEEIIVQCRELSEFNPSSVNTIRVVTLLDAHDKVHVMSGVLRMGTGNNCADNFHTNGIAATVDVETGLVISSAINRKYDRYIIHPDSKKQIIGYHVPMWDEIIETCKKAAYVVPKVRYVGWDIAIGEDNQIIMIEGNDNAARDVQQMPDLKGKWPMYKPLIEELEKM